MSGSAAKHVVHVTPVRTYLAVLTGLMVCTALTWGIAYQQLEGENSSLPWNTIVALAIAAFKSGIVIYWFMHVKHADRIVKVMVGGGVFFLLILFVLLMMDWKTRTYRNLDGWEMNTVTESVRGLDENGRPLPSQ